MINLMMAKDVRVSLFSCRHRHIDTHADLRVDFLVSLVVDGLIMSETTSTSYSKMREALPFFDFFFLFSVGGSKKIDGLTRKIVL